MSNLGMPRPDIFYNKNYSKLTNQLQSILFDRYFHKMTQHEIAKEIGVSVKYISKLEAKALKFLDLKA